MSTMNVSLPAELRAFVDRQVDEGRYSTASDYVRQLIRHDQDRQRLRNLLLAGASSPPGPIADAAYVAELRKRLEPDG